MPQVAKGRHPVLKRYVGEGTHLMKKFSHSLTQSFELAMQHYPVRAQPTNQHTDQNTQPQTQPTPHTHTFFAKHADSIAAAVIGVIGERKNTRGPKQRTEAAQRSMGNGNAAQATKRSLDQTDEKPDENGKRKEKPRQSPQKRKKIATACRTSAMS